MPPPSAMTKSPSPVDVTLAEDTTPMDLQTPPPLGGDESQSEKIPPTESGEQENGKNVNFVADHAKRNETTEELNETQEMTKQSHDNEVEEMDDEYDPKQEVPLRQPSQESQTTVQNGDTHMSGDESSEDKNNGDEQESDNAEDDETATLLSTHYKEYNLKIVARIPKGYRKDPVLLLINTAAEMFDFEDELYIKAHDWTDPTLPTIREADEIKSDSNSFGEYFGNVSYNKSKTYVSTIIRIRTSYSHVAWRQMLDPYLRKYAIKITLHNLEALETVCVGVLARKHQEITHLKHFGEYLKQSLKTDVPGFEFELKQLNIKIQSGFGETTMTSMVGVYTGPKNVALLEELFETQFPMNCQGKEFFISFRAGINDDRMKQLYEIHNSWIKAVEVIPVGGNRNIDTCYNLGFNKPISFREFIRNQPSNQGPEKIPMDVKNGGNNGRPMIIVKQTHLKEAKSAVARFQELKQKHHSAVDSMAFGHRQGRQTSHDMPTAADFEALGDIITQMTLEDNNGPTTHRNGVSTDVEQNRHHGHNSRQSSENNSMATARRNHRPASYAQAVSTKSCTTQQEPPPKEEMMDQKDVDLAEETLSTLTQDERDAMLLTVYKHLIEDKAMNKSIAWKYNKAKATTRALEEKLEKSLGWNSNFMRSAMHLRTCQNARSLNGR